jgi:uncharacterized membrane protein
MSAPTPPQPHPGWSDDRVDQVIGNLLRFGVLLSALVVFVGGVLYLYHQGRDPAPPQHLLQGKGGSFNRVLDVARDARDAPGHGLIELGLLLLIGTPIARVVFSVVAFIGQRDLVYVFITLVVLSILLFSLFSGHLS